MPKPVALTALARELITLTGGSVPTYRELWEKITNGQLRATRKKSRYFVDPLQAVEDLGLTVKKPAA